MASAVFQLLVCSHWRRGTASAPFSGPTGQERSEDQGPDRSKERDPIGILKSFDTLSTGQLEDA